MRKTIRTALSLALSLVLCGAFAAAQPQAGGNSSDKADKQHRSLVGKVAFWRRHKGEDTKSNAQAASKPAPAKTAAAKPASAKQPAAKSGHKPQQSPARADNKPKTKAASTKAPAKSSQVKLASAKKTSQVKPASAKKTTLVKPASAKRAAVKDGQKQAPESPSQK